VSGSGTVRDSGRLDGAGDQAGATEQAGAAGASDATEQAGASDATEQAGAAEERDWAWRRRIRSNPHSHRIYRTVVGIVGAVVTVGGLVMVPFPGPGWLVVFIGVGILASEFDWAKRLLAFGRERLRAWNDWIRPQPLWVKGLAALLTAAAVGLIFYALFLLTGVPGFLPDIVEEQVLRLPGL
jgi:uncharacterized protein (TIGR02611 family)